MPSPAAPAATGAFSAAAQLAADPAADPLHADLTPRVLQLPAPHSDVKWDDVLALLDPAAHV